MRDKKTSNRYIVFCKYRSVSPFDKERITNHQVEFRFANEDEAKAFAKCYSKCINAISAEIARVVNCECEYTERVLL